MKKFFTYFNKKKPKKETVSCMGCKYLDYYNDGSALCTKGLEKACIPNGFSCREITEECDENRRNKKND